MPTLWDRAVDFFGLSEPKSASQGGVSHKPTVSRAWVPELVPLIAAGSSAATAAPAVEPARGPGFSRRQTEAEARAAANSSVLEEYAKAVAVFTEAPALDGGTQGCAQPHPHSTAGAAVREPCVLRARGPTRLAGCIGATKTW